MKSKQQNRSNDCFIIVATLRFALYDSQLHSNDPYVENG